MGLILKAATILDDRGPVALVRHARLVALRKLHQLIWDRRYETIEAVPTGGYLLSDDLDPIDVTNHTPLISYLPTPRLVVRWVLKGLKINPADYSFVDIGSGRGRVLLQASEFPFQAVEGVEYSRVLHDEALTNIDHYPSKLVNAERLRSICMDAGRFRFPKGNCVVFLFNPFEPELLDVVMSNALKQVSNDGRQLIVIYYNPVYGEVFENEERLSEFRLSLLSRLKLFFLAPYPVRVFRSRPDN